MSTAIGSIINGGEPDSRSTSEGTTGSSERIAQPEILHGFDAIEPDTEPIGRAGAGSGGDGNTRRTRTGRIDRRTRAGRALTGESTSEEKESVHLGRLDLAEAIHGLHLTLSGFIPEMELDKDEAEHISKATKELGKYYAMTFDPKTVAWFNFCAALGSVYVPRAIAVRNRMKAESGPKPVKVIEKPAPAKPNGLAHTDFSGLPPLESGAIE